MKKGCEGKEYRQREEPNGTNLRIEKHKRTKEKDAAEQKRNFLGQKNEIDACAGLERRSHSLAYIYR